MKTKADLLKEMREVRQDLKDYAAEKKRLVRDLDVAMHGEADAAPQASLCDLIGPAHDMRMRMIRLEEALELILDDVAAFKAYTVSTTNKGDRIEIRWASLDNARQLLRKQ